MPRRPTRRNTTANADTRICRCLAPGAKVESGKGECSRSNANRPSRFAPYTLIAMLRCTPPSRQSSRQTGRRFWPASLLLAAFAVAGCSSNAPTPPPVASPSVEVSPPSPTPIALPTPPEARSQVVTSVVTSKDGQDEVTLPAGWTVETGLNAEAQIQAAHRERGMFVIVLSEPKQALPGMTREKHSQATRELLTQNLAESAVKGPTDVKTIHGNPAIQYVIQGALNNIAVKFLHTTLETPTQFVQILAWTRPDAFDANERELQQVIQSFREKPAPANPTVTPPSPGTVPAQPQ